MIIVLTIEFYQEQGKLSLYETVENDGSVLEHLKQY